MFSQAAFKTNLHEIVQHSFSIVLFQRHKESAPDAVMHRHTKKKTRGKRNTEEVKIEPHRIGAVLLMNSLSRH